MPRSYTLILLSEVNVVGLFSLTSTITCSAEQRCERMFLPFLSRSWLTRIRDNLCSVAVYVKPCAYLFHSNLILGKECCSTKLKLGKVGLTDISTLPARDKHTLYWECSAPWHVLHIRISSTETSCGSNMLGKPNV